METRFDINDGELKRYSGNESKIVIPSDVKKIGKRAFENSDVEVVEFENNSQLKEIDDYAFYKSEKLRGVVLPNGLLRIGSHAFEGCSLMSYLVIPNSVIEIGADAIKDTQSILAVLSDGNKEAEKIAESEWVPYITNVDAALSKIRDREQRAANVGAREFIISGTALTLTNSTITFNDIVNHYSSKGQDLYKAFFNTIPSTISESNVEKYAAQFKDALDREIKQVYERLSSQGIYLREGKLEGMAASAMKPVMDLRNAIMNFRSALVEDANTEIHDAVDRNKRWISSQITGLTYGMIGSTADLLLYSIDDYITKERQKKAAYSTADAQFIKEYNSIISKYDELLKTQLNDVEDTIEKGTYQIIDKLGKIESMLLTKVGLIDLKHIDQEIAAGTIRRMKTTLESKEQKSSDIMRSISNSYGDHSTELGIAIKNNPYNIDAYCYAFKNGLAVETIMEIIDFLGVSEDVIRNLNYEYKEKFKEELARVQSKKAADSVQELQTKADEPIEQYAEKSAEKKPLENGTFNEVPKASPVAGININPNNVEPTITRIELFLEDGEWDRAMAYAEAGLDYFPTDYRLYLLLICAKKRAAGINELEEYALSIQEDTLFKRAKRFITPEGMQEYGYLFDVEDLEKYVSAKTYAADKQFRDAIDLLSTIPDYKNATELIAEYKEKLEKEEEEKRKEAEEKERKEREERRAKEEKERKDLMLYEKSVADFEKAETIADYQKSMSDFNLLQDYRDSKQYARKAMDMIQALRDENLVKQFAEKAKEANTIADCEMLLSQIYPKRYELNVNDLIAELEEKKNHFSKIEKDNFLKQITEDIKHADTPEACQKLLDLVYPKKFEWDLRDLIKELEEKRNDLSREKKYNMLIEDFTSADSILELNQIAEKFKLLRGYKDSQQYAELAVNEGKYRRAISYLSSNSDIEKIQSALNILLEIENYKDSKKRIELLSSVIDQYTEVSMKIDSISNVIKQYTADMNKLGIFDRRRKRELEEEISQKNRELEDLEKERMLLLSQVAT